jgi:hypothetical protein
MSFASAAVTPDTPRHEAVKQAERLLYEAKRSGRNCLVSESFAQKSEKDFVFPPESV